jgi:hypothetical protein
MHRLTSALLLGGGVLLTSYISAPAAPTPAPARVSTAVLDEIEAMAPLAADVAQESERLRSRLAVVPAAQDARRDPFNFGAPRRAVPVVTVSAPVLPAPDVEITPTIVWPSLAAVMTGVGDATALTAVFGIGDGIAMLRKGETTGGFLVRDVTSSSVELMHVATSTVRTLSIR